MPAKLVLCDCLGSQTLDPDALARASGLRCSKIFTALCTDEAEDALKEIASGEAIVCCGQEQRFFQDLAEDHELPEPAFLDLRDRAGWTDDKGSVVPKMAALVAEATLEPPQTKLMDVSSGGLCLIVGKGEVAFDAAAQLADQLGVTVLQLDETDPPPNRDFDVIRGQIRRASGSLGRFKMVFDRLSQVVPGGRGAWSWTEPKDNGASECDIILDLSGDPPLFPAPNKRDGYLRADPGGLGAVSSAIFQAAQLIGGFEKPFHVRYEPLLCAHSRAEQAGCSKCLDVCPTGAIVTNGDYIKVDPAICAGCGACSALCPSGAISYDAPPLDFTFRRIQTMAKAYREAGGVNPRLLVVDAHGSEMVRLSARLGRGLPTDVVPFETVALAGFGHAEILAALAAGFGNVTILVAPTTDRDVLISEIALANAITAGGATLLDTVDPDEMADMLYSGTHRDAITNPIRPMGTRRQIARQAAKALVPDASQIALPQGAPYGAVLVDTDACTLCHSCVSLCPSGALGDNPDLPQLQFQEDACLQCGLCANICPEDAITYEPRLNLEDSALSNHILNEEEPFACVECGSLFGSKRAIDKITEKLTGHSMFQGADALRMIQMCEDCRVDAQFHSEDNPFTGGERPKVRTTEDYLSKRRDH